MKVLMSAAAAVVVPGAENVDPARWLGRFDDMFAEVVAPAFGRREPRLRACAYLLGLVLGLERRNGWSLAEFAGDATPGWDAAAAERGPVGPGRRA